MIGGCILSCAIIIAVAVAAKPQGGLTGVNGFLRGSTEASKARTLAPSLPKDPVLTVAF